LSQHAGVTLGAYPDALSPASWGPDPGPPAPLIGYADVLSSDDNDARGANSVGRPILIEPSPAMRRRHTVPAGTDFVTGRCAAALRIARDYADTRVPTGIGRPGKLSPPAWDRPDLHAHDAAKGPPSGGTAHPGLVSEAAHAALARALNGPHLVWKSL